MLQLQEQDNKYRIIFDGRDLGAVRLYDHPFHQTNCYVTPELINFDPAISAELFDALYEIAGRPLQVMVSSADTALTLFLQAGGFCCRRRCYEVEASATDYLGTAAELPLRHCQVGEPDYEAACRLMYAYYGSTHKAINPLTADFAAFCKILPEQASVLKQGETVVAAAFIEHNEIAYVCGRDEHSFLPFASGLLSSMLAEHPTVFFESDDCDWAAMIMKSMFASENLVSYDTYILDKPSRIEIKKELSGTILDLGGGGEGIIGRLYGQKVTAIDNRQEELDNAPGVFKKVLMDATELQYADYTFDHVTSFFTLMYMRAEEQQKALLEASRVLKEGGTLHIWDCDIASAYPEPFCIDLEITLPDAMVLTTYGVGKQDPQNRNSITQMCLDAGLRCEEERQSAAFFYLGFRKKS